MRSLLLEIVRAAATLSNVREVSTPGVGWSWGSTLTPNYGGLGGGGGGEELSNSATS